jgi:hypothetical protein
LNLGAAQRISANELRLDDLNHNLATASAKHRTSQQVVTSSVDQFQARN